MMGRTSFQALVVDYDRGARAATAGALRVAGFHCDEAEDGQQASQMLDRRAYDLVVTELLLPKVNGHTLVVQLTQRTNAPRVVVLTHLTDSRLIRDVLARGADDYLHKSIPAELLATKLVSFFEIDAWRAGQHGANGQAAGATRDALLAAVEQQIANLSKHFAPKIEPLFNFDYPLPDVPPAISAFVQRLAHEERAELQAGLASDANERGNQRVELQTTATAVLVDDNFNPLDDPFRVMLRDISIEGVRMMHTRAISARDMVISWPAETIPYYAFQVPLFVTRCRPLSRFYDIGGEFGEINN